MSFFDFEAGLEILCSMNRIPKERKKLVFLTFVQVYKEEEIFRKCVALTFNEIQTLAQENVLYTGERPMIVEGGFGIFEDLPQPNYYIYIRNSLSYREKLVTFIHELLHIFILNNYELLNPNEDVLTQTAYRLLNRYWDELVKLYNDLPKEKMIDSTST